MGPHHEFPSEPEVQALVARAQDGDTAAFERLYQHFFAPIYRYTAFRTSGDVAEDVVAEIFVRAWEKLHRYKPHKGVPFGAWLFRIARHAVIDVYRKDHEVVELSDDTADPDALNRADASFRQREIVRIVRDALEQLPRRYREVLSLCYIADLSTEDAARVLHLTSGAVRILKFRALRKLELQLPAGLCERSPDFS